MKILAIDPGTTESAALVWDGQNVERPMIIQNEFLLAQLAMCGPAAYDIAAVEMVACYGMAVGREVFETCVWIGRFYERMHAPPQLVYRQQVKLHHCHSNKAKDANVRQALLDRFGGKHVAIGNKRNPGAFYGLRSHLWSALAIATYVHDTQAERMAA